MTEVTDKIYEQLREKEYQTALRKLSSTEGGISLLKTNIKYCFATCVLTGGENSKFIEEHFNELWKKMINVHNYDEGAKTDILIAMATSLKRTACGNTRDGFCYTRMKTNAAPRITEKEATSMQCDEAPGLTLRDGEKKWESHFKGDNESFFNWVIAMYRKFPQFERQLFADADAKFALKKRSDRKVQAPTAPKKVIKKVARKANKSSSSAKPARKKELRNTGQPCAYCGGPAKIFCSGCEEKKEETYCSQEHQNLHWPEHQPFCKSCTN